MSSTFCIDLKKLQNNLDAVNRRLSKNVKRMAVIKDNAYGHGLGPISEFLADKVDWFCVAKLDEAVELRKSGIKNPILVFEIPPIGREGEYVKYNLRACIADLSVFERLEPGTHCHLKFDTGMGRLGMLPQDASSALEKMKHYPHLNYEGIYTHFANADVRDHPTVKKQADVFNDLRAQFPSEMMTHTANSGAIFYNLHHNLQYDAVRPGVCLYGYAPGKEEVKELEIIGEWKTKLSQVKRISKGDCVGYGSRWEAQENCWLGIIQPGYAYGIPRSLSGKFNVQINGKLYPQVGTISMDYSAVYLGNDELEAGTEVTLLNGTNLTARKWADALETIPYEIITGISDRVPRIYTK